MMKAGAVMAKRMSEWFDPLNTAHVRAFMYYRQTGKIPVGFLPSDVYLDIGWDYLVFNKIQGRVPKEVQDELDELKRLLGIISDVKFPGYTFRVEPLAGEFYIQVVYDEADTLSGAVETQEGRKWLFPAGQTEGQVIQTCLKAILTSLEHRAREHFTYKDKAVLMPHFPMEQLLAIAPANPHTEEIFK